MHFLTCEELICIFLTCEELVRIRFMHEEFGTNQLFSGVSVHSQTELVQERIQDFWKGDSYV